ncbi:MAG: DUF6644 family protein [Pseudolabrys sp.]|jgi:hypothetical protein
MNPALTKSLNSICAWIDQTTLSQAIQVTKWVVPTVQTVHILAIAAVASSALMIDLRLIGVFWADRPMRNVSSRFLPFVWWPLLILFVTGALMIIAEPARSLKNPAFQLKMTLLVAALIVTGLIQYFQRRDAGFGELGRGSHAVAVAVAIVSLALWSAIIFAGRWIAYYA